MRAMLFAALLAALSCGKDLAQLEPFPCARDYTCPTGYVCVNQQMCQRYEPCALVESQNQCQSPDQRCTVIAPVTGAFVTQCVSDAGTSLHEGDVCASPPDGLYTGTDACVKGSICYNEGTAISAQEPVSKCRVFCNKDSDCASGQGCVAGFPGPQFYGVVTSGVCETKCDPFGGGCGDPGTHCDAIPGMAAATGIPVCRTNGAVAEGGNCLVDSCAPGLLCTPGLPGTTTGPLCRRACDNTNHLCSSGSCDTVTFSLGNGVGFCH